MKIEWSFWTKWSNLPNAALSKQHITFFSVLQHQIVCRTLNRLLNGLMMNYLQILRCKLNTSQKNIKLDALFLSRADLLNLGVIIIWESDAGKVKRCSKYSSNRVHNWDFLELSTKKSKGYFCVIVDMSTIFKSLQIIGSKICRSKDYKFSVFKVGIWFWEILTSRNWTNWCIVASKSNEI